MSSYGSGIEKMPSLNLDLIRTITDVDIPLAHATELPLEEKKAAVRGALELKLGLAEDYETKVEEMISTGKISSEAAQELYKLSLAHTGVMLDYVHNLVGFEGNHGPDIEPDSNF